MKPKIWLTALVILTAVFLGIWKAKEFIQVDDCLDHGGSWNYEKSFCDTTGEIEIVTQVKSVEVTSDTFQTKENVDLKRYIGTYSKQTDFFENPIVVKELQRILGTDYDSYKEHVSLSGCGEVNYKYGLIYGDVSQLHVGGYGSIFFIDVDDNDMHLFWLKESVRKKNYTIYGDKPIPANVLNLISEEMNIGWGHVAEFKIIGDSIEINLK